MAEFLGELGLILIALGGIGAMAALYFFNKEIEKDGTETDEFLTPL